MTQPNGMTLTVDLAGFSDMNLRHVCALTHLIATDWCQRRIQASDLLLAIAAGLDEARRDRATALEVLARDLDDHEAGGLVDGDDITEGMTPDV